MKKFSRSVMVLALALALMLAFAPNTLTQAAEKNEGPITSDDLQFVKAKTTVSLAGVSLFDLLKHNVTDWPVVFKISITAKNTAHSTVYFEGRLSNGSGNEHKTIASVGSGKKKTFSLSYTTTIGRVVDGGLTESQALALLNGKEVKVNSVQQVIYLNATLRRSDNGNGYSVFTLGDAVLTVAANEVNSSVTINE